MFPVPRPHGSAARPQHQALAVAFGLHTGPPPNPFLVGLAVLGLLSEAAEERPLLAIVDDAHWLDHGSARALPFVARRLLAERIGLLFATRHIDAALRGLPELRISPLPHRDARALLESVLPARLDEAVLERIVIETRGNPLALLELPRGLTPAELAGGFGLPGFGAVVGQHRGKFHPATGWSSRRRPALLAGRGDRSGRRSGARVAGGGDDSASRSRRPSLSNRKAC